MADTTDAPYPLVPAEADLSDFQFTPIFRARLFSSRFHARVTDAEWRAGVTLWLKSWDQVPAGSLPDDDIDLCRLAELGRDVKAWRKVRAGALHGWVKCSDGLLYHPVVAEGVNEAWTRKTKTSRRGAAGAKAKWASSSEANHKTRSERLANARQKGTHTIEEWEELLRICGTKCLNCGSDSHIVKDHVVPIYKGGSDAIDNIQPLCGSCNSSKGPDETDRRPPDWRLQMRISMPDRTPAPTASNACITPALTPAERLQMPGNRQGQGQGQGQGEESSELRSAQAPADRLFTEGIAIIGELTGKSRDAAAKLIGNWRKSAKNDDLLLETILAAAKERPIHAVSWIAAGLKARAGPKGANGKHDPTHGAPSEDDPHGIAAWIARQNTEPGTDQDTGQQVPCINGYVLEDACETTLEAIAQGGGSFCDRVNFDAMAGWCRDDVIASQAFIATIRRISRALPDPVRSLAVFDAAVREAAARSAA